MTSTNEPDDMTPMQRHQAFLDHVSARGKSALTELETKGGFGEGSMHDQSDLDRYEATFGDPATEEINKVRAKIKQINSSGSGEPDMRPLGDVLFSPPKKGKTK